MHSPDKTSGADNFLDTLKDRLAAVYGVAEFTGHEAENVAERRTQGAESGDGSDGNESGNQTVFDGRRARLVTIETVKRSGHGFGLLLWKNHAPDVGRNRLKKSLGSQ